MFFFKLRISHFFPVIPPHHFCFPSFLSKLYSFTAFESLIWASDNLFLVRFFNTHSASSPLCCRHHRGVTLLALPATLRPATGRAEWNYGLWVGGVDHLPPGPPMWGFRPERSTTCFLSVQPWKREVPSEEPGGPRMAGSRRNRPRCPPFNFNIIIIGRRILGESPVTRWKSGPELCLVD